MSIRNELLLHEEILLLALREEEGTVVSGTMYHYAIGGAIVAELLLRNRIQVDESSQRNLVDVTSRKPVGDSLVDESLVKIATAKRRASIQDWVDRFSTQNKLKERVAQSLCESGILREEDARVLFFFKEKVYPEVDPEPELRLRNRLRHAIFTDAENVDARTVVLVSLAQNTGLLNTVFNRKELKSRKKRIEKVMSGETTGKAASEAIQAMQAALFATTLVPVLAATVAGAS